MRDNLNVGSWQRAPADPEPGELHPVFFQIIAFAALGGTVGLLLGLAWAVGQWAKVMGW